MEFISRLHIENANLEDKRRCLRFPLSLSAVCHLKNTGVGGECRIIDISQEGLCFEIETDAAIRLGQNMLLSIYMPDRPEPFSAIARSRWVERPVEACTVQRVGSHLLFMDMREKEELLMHAYAGVIAAETQSDNIPYTWLLY